MFIFIILCILIIELFVVSHYVRRIKACKTLDEELRYAKRFYVRVSLPFCNHNQVSGTAVFYHERDFLNEANGDLDSLLQMNFPNFNFPTIKPIPASELKQNNLPLRITGKKKIFDSNLVVFLKTKYCLIQISRALDSDPFACYWIGICITSENELLLTEIMKGLKSALKEKGTC